MKKLLVLLAGLAVISCANEPKIDYTLVSGKIENKKGDEVVIYANGTMKKIALNEDGSFADTLRIAGYYKFAHDRNATNIFLAPAKELKITTDSNHFMDSLRYDGEGAAVNNYLMTKTLRNKKHDATAIFSKEEVAFVEKMKEIRDDAKKHLKEFKGLDEAFVTLEQKNLQFSHLLNLSRYPNFYVNYFKHPDYVPSEEFNARFKDVDYDNEEDYKKYQSYRDLVQGHYNEKVDPEKDVKAAIETVKSIKSESIKQELIEGLAYYVSPSFKESDYLYNELSALITDEEMKEELTEKYNTMQNLVAGKDSPTFDYENHKGGNTTLADLQGKYVYIDVWATWCGPCLQEIPSLKKVEKQYHDKNIHFVSISIDETRDHGKWKKMVDEKELGGIQLMADNAWKSKFVTDYAIEGIPRFILIGPDGKIVNADAPRPSDEKLIELFDELKI
ncbi:MAG: TlpA disulfide reductase family protein [Bacteroidota bacterium]